MYVLLVILLLSFRALYVLVVVQVVDIGTDPNDLSTYKLEDLIAGTTQYIDSRTRRKRQTPSVGHVYIAANISETDLASGFTLGDGNYYGGYRNYELEEPGTYTVGLWSQIQGTDIPIILNSVTSQPISKSTSNYTVWYCYTVVVEDKPTEFSCVYR